MLNEFIVLKWLTQVNLTESTTIFYLATFCRRFERSWCVHPQGYESTIITSIYKHYCTQHDQLLTNVRMSVSKTALRIVKRVLYGHLNKSLNLLEVFELEGG